MVTNQVPHVRLESLFAEVVLVKRRRGVEGVEGGGEAGGAGGGRAEGAGGGAGGGGGVARGAADSKSSAVPGVVAGVTVDRSVTSFVTTVASTRSDLRPDLGADASAWSFTSTGSHLRSLVLDASATGVAMADLLEVLFISPRSCCCRS
jgi:hypothetical protein